MALMIGGGAPVFSTADDDYSQWDTVGKYPADVMGTQLLIPVRYLMDRGIITGDADRLFHPGKNITRAELATMVARATNSPTELEAIRDEQLFDDLAGYGWARSYINAVARAGFFNGRSHRQFVPGENVTYAEAITVMIRLHPGAADTAEAMGSKWPGNYIAYAETYNMTANITVYNWNAPATRGDVAWLLYRVLPKASNSREHVRSVAVNGKAAEANGRDFSIDIGSEDIAVVSIAASSSIFEINGGVRNSANVTRGLGVINIPMKAEAKPCVIDFSIQSGTDTRRYTLTINGTNTSVTE